MKSEYEYMCYSVLGFRCFSKVFGDFFKNHFNIFSLLNELIAFIFRKWGGDVSNVGPP